MTNTDTETRFVLASNAVIHRNGCEHANRVKVLFAGPSIEMIREYGQMDFENKRITVAPCAK